MTILETTSPVLNTYEPQNFNGIAHSLNKLSGGAPNNFTKLRNERIITPFSSTTPRFQQTSRKNAKLIFSAKLALGPGEY
jgi:hypothetical protein